jgi:peptidoglycan/LPS O-acetylase OafA/YrhL
VPAVAPEPPRYEFVDALRGIAVLGVVALHTTQNFHATRIEPLLSLGECGVQLFYIVSAFSLCLSLDQRSRNERHPFINYAIRRFFRIAPLFYLAIMAEPFVLPADSAPMTLVGAMAGYHALWPRRPWHTIATVLFINGWHYASISSPARTSPPVI